MRTYVIAGFLSLALVCALVGGVAAQQQPAATPSPATGAQASPSQTAPQTSTTPGTTPGAAPSPSQTSDDNPINLTDEQQTKLRPILLDERMQMEALQNDTTMTTDQKVAKAQQIREAAAPKIKAILTPEQLQKLSEMQKEREQQNQSAPANGSAPPPHQ